MLQSRTKRRRIATSTNPAPVETKVGRMSLEEEREELRRMSLEIEPITVKRSSSRSSEPPPIIGYRPTYRAVLAKKGYLVKNTLGSGSYSKVKKALSFKNNAQLQLAAVKIIDRQRAPQDYQEKFMPRELDLWPRFRHPNLIALTDCFQDTRRVYMVLEYADGGDALRYIQRSGAISEEFARTWIGQVADAVGYMHKLDISHRDLKLENLLLDRQQNIKICDFGFVKKICGVDDLSHTYCGSKSYAAPEILKGTPYDPKKADIWAIGVILYIFVVGKMPFDETKGTKSILEEQRALDFQWPAKPRRLTGQCQALIKRMFTWEFVARPDIFDVLSNDWFLRPARPHSSPEGSTSSSRVLRLPVSPTKHAHHFYNTRSTAKARAAISQDSFVAQ